LVCLSSGDFHAPFSVRGIRFPFLPMVHQRKARSRPTDQNKLVLVAHGIEVDPEYRRSLRPVRSSELTIEIRQYADACLPVRSPQDSPYMTWREYHELTKHSVESLRRTPHYLDWANMPNPFRHMRAYPFSISRPTRRLRRFQLSTYSRVKQEILQPKMVRNSFRS